MESVLDDLCSRIYDIQMCIECAVNGGADQQHIRDLTTKMCKIEKELQLIEEEVNAQLPLVNRAEVLIQRMQEINKITEEITIDENDENYEKEELKPLTKPKKEEQPVRKSVSKIPALEKKASNSGESTKLFKNVNEKDVAQLKLYKVPLDVLNKVIDEMNELLQRKARIMKSKRGVDDPLFREVSEDIEQGFGISVTSNDIHELPNLKKNSRKYLSALKELGLITSTTTGTITRHYPK